MEINSIKQTKEKQINAVHTPKIEANEKKQETRNSIERGSMEEGRAIPAKFRKLLRCW